MEKGIISYLKPALIFSFAVNTFSILAFAFKYQLVDGLVVLSANLLLTFIFCFNVSKHIKTTNHANPHAMVRGVMSGVVLKLFVLGGAAFIYLYAAGEKRNTNALFLSMVLYIVYTWLEVRLVTSIKKDSDA